MCQLANVYGRKNPLDGTVKPAKDPRPGRTVATLRYEWYWIWSLQYSAHSWLMLIDARDTYFQSNPFAKLPRFSSPEDPSVVDSGVLYMFGESTNATRLGLSKKNKNWIRRGYGDDVMAALQDKPTICSGSTMGEQVAVETYLRALINEHDEAHVKMAGSDQGFHNVSIEYVCTRFLLQLLKLHNDIRSSSTPASLTLSAALGYSFLFSLSLSQYLYYSRKLANADAINRIVLWDQGRGIINNVGALRTMPLEDWKIYNDTTHEVFQWDLQTLSPVVHQWDRDKQLHAWMNGKRHRAWSAEWLERQQQKKRAEVKAAAAQ